MERLYVLYDAECALCRRCKAWLMSEPAYIKLEFIPRNAPDLEERFRGVGEYQESDDLVVISDEGDLYYGPRAWIVCLFALREYRGWAYRFSDPALFPFVRRFFDQISRNRLSVSRWLFGVPEETVDEECDGVCMVGREQR